MLPYKRLNEWKWWVIKPDEEPLRKKTEMLSYDQITIALRIELRALAELPIHDPNVDLSAIRNRAFGACCLWDTITHRYFKTHYRRINDRETFFKIANDMHR